MQTFTQLNPTLPMLVVGKGNGYAFAVIDYHEEHHLMWVIAMDETGEIWTVPNPLVRIQNNWTLGRTVKAPVPEVKPFESVFARHEPTSCNVVPVPMMDGKK